MLAGDTIEPVWVQTLEIYWTQSLSSPKRTYYHLQHKSFSQQRKTFNIRKSLSYIKNEEIIHEITLY
jgi:uncharacterized protein YbcV (DUF1398 family)